MTKLKSLNVSETGVADLSILSTLTELDRLVLSSELPAFDKDVLDRFVSNVTVLLC